MRDPKDIKIGDYTLEEILERHQHWLNRDCENWESMQADLHNVDLHDANMSYANMRCVDLHDANMRGANMSCADMSCADMRGVNMMGANMRGANMRYANMSCADMRGTNMIDTDMRGADLHGANISYAYMSCTDMRYVNMRDADISYADMRYANMSCADMRGVNMRYANMSCADMRGTNMSCADMRYANMSSVDRLRKGIKLSEPIIGWKKCKNDVLVKLEIPRGAIVFSINNKKCRTDKAKVLEIIGADRAYSNHKFFSYYVGDVIEIFDFNCQYNVECAKGIHFFKTREEAENY